MWTISFFLGSFSAKILSSIFFDRVVDEAWDSPWAIEDRAHYGNGRCALVGVYVVLLVSKVEKVGHNMSHRVCRCEAHPRHHIDLGGGPQKNSHLLPRPPNNSSSSRGNNTCLLIKNNDWMKSLDGPEWTGAKPFAISNSLPKSEHQLVHLFWPSTIESKVNRHLAWVPSLAQSPLQR